MQERTHSHSLKQMGKDNRHMQQRKRLRSPPPKESKSNHHCPKKILSLHCCCCHLCDGCEWLLLLVFDGGCPCPLLVGAASSSFDGGGSFRLWQTTQRRREHHFSSEKPEAFPSSNRVKLRNKDVHDMLTCGTILNSSTISSVICGISTSTVCSSMCCTRACGTNLANSTPSCNI